MQTCKQGGRRGVEDRGAQKGEDSAPCRTVVVGLLQADDVGARLGDLGDDARQAVVPRERPRRRLATNGRGRRREVRVEGGQIVRGSAHSRREAVVLGRGEAGATLPYVHMPPPNYHNYPHVDKVAVLAEAVGQDVERQDAQRRRRRRRLPVAAAAAAAAAPRPNDVGVDAQRQLDAPQFWRHRVAHARGRRRRRQLRARLLLLRRRRLRGCCVCGGGRAWRRRHIALLLAVALAATAAHPAAPARAASHGSAARAQQSDGVACCGRPQHAGWGWMDGAVITSSSDHPQNPALKRAR